MNFNMRSIIPTGLILAGAGVMVPSLAPAQAVLDKTTLGQEQNDERDLYNSLVPGPQKYGKGEKKAQISASELKSKGLKDSTFGGSLLNMGIDPSAPKLDSSKERLAPSETEKRSAGVKEQAAATQTESTASKPGAEASKEPTAATQSAENQSVFSNLSTTATLADSLSDPDVAAAELPSSSSSTGDQKKDQSGGTTNEKSSTATSSDKSSTSKPDGH